MNLGGGKIGTWVIVVGEGSHIQLLKLHPFPTWASVPGLNSDSVSLTLCYLSTDLRRVNLLTISLTETVLDITFTSSRILRAFSVSVNETSVIIL